MPDEIEDCALLVVEWAVLVIHSITVTCTVLVIP
jgi:hypothetical protein